MERIWGVFCVVAGWGDRFGVRGTRVGAFFGWLFLAGSIGRCGLGAVGALVVVGTGSLFWAAWGAGGGTALLWWCGGGLGMWSGA